jgi:hypothetical protein
MSTLVARTNSTNFETKSDKYIRKKIRVVLITKNKINVSYPKILYILE